MTSRKPILISGAGLASLLLGQALRRASIPFLIFEREASLSFRAQGYRLRLSTEGLDAIESVLSPEDWKNFWDTCGKTGGTKGGFAAINARTGERVPEEPKSNEPNTSKGQLTSRDGKTIGIARGEMRSLFMTGCEDYVQWSHQITGYEKTPNGVRAVFADGSKSVEGEMLVGGDGIHSKIAKQLSDGKLKVFDTGARGIHGQAPVAAFDALGEGVWIITDDSHPSGRVFIITNVRPVRPEDPKDLMFGWTMGAQPGVIKVDDVAIIGKPAADIARELTKDWHPRFKPLIDNMAEGETAFWKMTCSTPSGIPEWESEPRVTLIGDAVHSMTPAGGIGANTAVRDSALLGRLFTEAGGYTPSLVSTYEKEMKVYGSEAVRTSYGLAESQFGVKIDENSSEI